MSEVICDTCGYSMEEMGDGTFECPYCLLSLSWWSFMLERTAHELIDKLDWNQVALTIEPENEDSMKWRKDLREEIIRRLTNREYAIGMDDGEQL